MESIRIGIFELAKIEEYYSLNILYRSLVEHFIKAQYIWMSAVSSKDDTIGIDYWLFGKDQEIIDYAKALQHSYSLIGITPETSPVETLKNMGVISKGKSATQIRKKSEQFKYKNMVLFISEFLKTKDSGAAPVLTSIFPRYSELSSCVHGGPESVGAHEKGPEVIKEILEMAAFSSLYTRWTAFVLIYQYEKNVEPLCQITQRYLHKYTGHNNSSNLTGAQDAPAS